MKKSIFLGLLIAFCAVSGCTSETNPPYDCNDEEVKCVGWTKYVCYENNWYLSTEKCECYGTKDAEPIYENRLINGKYVCRGKVCDNNSYVDIKEQFTQSCSIDSTGKMEPKGECVNGEIECKDENFIKMCSNGRFNEVACQSCNDGDKTKVSCGNQEAGRCQDEEAKCVKGAVYSCQDGVVTYLSCPYGCLEGACLPAPNVVEENPEEEKCGDGDMRCVVTGAKLYIQTCQEDKWNDGEECEGKCVINGVNNIECQNDCVNGEFRCDNNILMKCEKGNWTEQNCEDKICYVSEDKKTGVCTKCYVDGNEQYGCSDGVCWIKDNIENNKCVDCYINDDKKYVGCKNGDLCHENECMECYIDDKGENVGCGKNWKCNNDRKCVECESSEDCNDNMVCYVDNNDYKNNKCVECLKDDDCVGTAAKMRCDKTNGKCVDVDECASGETRCVNENSYKICLGNRWSNPIQVTNLCGNNNYCEDNGLKIPNNQLYCIGNKLQHCKDGKFDNKNEICLLDVLYSCNEGMLKSEKCIYGCKNDNKCCNDKCCDNQETCSEKFQNEKCDENNIECGRDSKTSKGYYRVCLENGEYSLPIECPNGNECKNLKNNFVCTGSCILNGFMVADSVYRCTPKDEINSNKSNIIQRCAGNNKWENENFTVPKCDKSVLYNCDGVNDYVICANGCANDKECNP